MSGNTRRRIAIALAACSLALPAAASADAQLAPYTSDPPSWADDPALYSIRPQTGEKLPVFNDDEPAAIEVVRPERTIVRDVDEALPLILSSTALLLALAGVALTLRRTRIAPRH